MSMYVFIKNLDPGYLGQDVSKLMKLDGPYKRYLKSSVSLFILCTVTTGHTEMESANVRSKPFTRSYCEESTFIEVFCRNKKTHNDVIMRRIYEKIRDDENTNDNLKDLYHEALFGSDKKILKRMRYRISAMKRDHK